MNLLQAAAGQPQQPSPWGFYIMIGLMILVLWLFMWRPESKRRKEMQKFREGLKKGDKVITAGGIYGTVKEIKERTLLIEVDGNVTLRVDKNMVVALTTSILRPPVRCGSRPCGSKWSAPRSAAAADVG